MAGFDSKKKKRKRFDEKEDEFSENKLEEQPAGKQYALPKSNSTNNYTLRPRAEERKNVETGAAVRELTLSSPEGKQIVSEAEFVSSYDKNPPKTVKGQLKSNIVSQKETIKEMLSVDMAKHGADLKSRSRPIVVPGIGEIPATSVASDKGAGMLNVNETIKAQKEYMNQNKQLLSEARGFKQIGQGLSNVATGVMIAEGIDMIGQGVTDSAVKAGVTRNPAEGAVSKDTEGLVQNGTQFVSQINGNTGSLNFSNFDAGKFVQNSASALTGFVGAAASRVLGISNDPNTVTGQLKTQMGLHKE